METGLGETERKGSELSRLGVTAAAAARRPSEEVRHGVSDCEWALWQRFGRPAADHETASGADIDRSSRSRSTRTSRPSPHALVEEELLAQTHAHGRVGPDESLRWKPLDEQPVLARVGLLDRCAGRCCPWS